MRNEELTSGLKNAIENGSSLEQAKRSFINAGYNQREVEQAAKEISSGVFHPVQKLPETTYPKQQIKEQETTEQTEKKSFWQKIPLIGRLFKKKEKISTPKPSSIPPLPTQPQQQPTQHQPQQQPIQQVQQQPQPEAKHKDKTKIIAIIFSIVLFILLVLLFLTIFFRKAIVNLF